MFSTFIIQRTNKIIDDAAVMSEKPFLNFFTVVSKTPFSSVYLFPSNDQPITLTIIVNLACTILKKITT